MLLKETAKFVNKPVHMLASKMLIIEIIHIRILKLLAFRGTKLSAQVKSGHSSDSNMTADLLDWLRTAAKARIAHLANAATPLLKLNLAYTLCRQMPASFKSKHACGLFIETWL